MKLPPENSEPDPELIELLKGLADANQATWTPEQHLAFAISNIEADRFDNALEPALPFMREHGWRWISTEYPKTGVAIVTFLDVDVFPLTKPIIKVTQ